MTSYPHPAASSRTFLPYNATAEYNAVRTESPILSDSVPGLSSVDDRSSPPFALTTFLFQCLVPPLLGLSFFAFGIYIVYASSPIVISHSTENGTIISQAFIALFAIWHFFALIPALGLANTIRSEEWWRRLLHSTPFAHTNSVSSNIDGNLAHGAEILLSWSSQYFKVAWFTAIIAVILADIAPGAIRVEAGLEPVDASFLVPALPANSIYSDYSKPFFMTNDFVHASVDIAPMYYAALSYTGSFVTGTPSVLNALIPRPNVVNGQGYRYATDVAFMNYQCDWYAPEVAEPDTMSDLTAQNLSITVGGIQTVGVAPLFANAIYLLGGNRNAITGLPSFDGYVAFMVTSGTPPIGYGFLNLSTVPTYTLSPAWQAAAAAFRANQTSGVFSPPQHVSAVMCTPRYAIESWTAEFVNSTVKLVKPLSYSVGNLDPTQLQIAIQDVFNLLPTYPPIISTFGVSSAILNTLFNFGTDEIVLGEPKYAPELDIINVLGFANSLQAYLDNFPFGSFTPVGSKLLNPALILTAQLDFLCVAAALYVLLTATLFYLFRRTPARPLIIQNVIDVTRPAPPSEHVSRGHDAAAVVERLAHLGHDGNDAEKEMRVQHLIASRTAAIRADHMHHQNLEIETTARAVALNPQFERFINARNRFAWVLTPLSGLALVAFGVIVYLHPHDVGTSGSLRATLYGALFTWAIGLWRSVSLIGVNALFRRANSDEWSRVVRHHEKSGLDPNLRQALNEVSTNNLSFGQAFRATFLTRTSTFYKVCYIATLLASFCAIVAQGVVTLRTLPYYTDDIIPIPIEIFIPPPDVPWSADINLAPYEAGKIGVGMLATNWVYLEHVVGATLSDALPTGYQIPMRGSTNNTYGSQYPTDVVRVQCDCQWVAPTLPAATANASYIPVALESLGILAIQTVPKGIATFAPLSNMTFSNTTPITSGMFAWTLWGGGPGDPVNLDSVPYTNISAAWQKLIADEYAPDSVKAASAQIYLTNLTRVSTLVCDPHIDITPALAHAFGGIITLAPHNETVGNVDRTYVSYLVYDYAVQQAQDVVGVFRPYLLFGIAPGQAVLQADPGNSANGTVPRSTTDIASTLNGYIGSASKAWMQMSTSIPNSTMDVHGQIIQQSLVVTAGLPQVIVAFALYLLLALSAIAISMRTPGAPFTLAGILMMHSKLTALDSTGDSVGREEIYELGEKSSEGTR